MFKVGLDLKTTKQCQKHLEHFGFKLTKKIHLLDKTSSVMQYGGVAAGTVTSESEGWRSEPPGGQATLSGDFICEIHIFFYFSKNFLPFYFFQ